MSTDALELTPSQEAHDARLRVMAARVIAQQRWPYVSTLLFTLRLVELPHTELETMAVDSGWRMYYSATFVLGEKPENLATVLLHEAMHCLNAHAARFAALSQPPHKHGLWNYAGDAAINEVLDDEKMPWPTVKPVRYADLFSYGVTAEMSTEGAFFALLDYQDQHPDKNQLGTTDCGSVVDGNSRVYEISKSDAISPAVRSDQQAITRDRVAHDIIQHSKNRGDVPAGLLRWAESITHPKVNWREALASKLRRDLAMVAGRRDYVYTRPSRRQDAMRASGSTVVLPAMRQPAPPRVSAVIDTSGSIEKDELRSFMTEVIGIARASGVSTGVQIIACDAQAYPAQSLRTHGDVERIELRGGGGTDMGAGIDAAVAARPCPHIVVVFTDGYTPWPETKPRKVDSVIVVLSTESQVAEVPDWCTTILLDAHE